MDTPIICSICKTVIVPNAPGNFTSGYGYTNADLPICYACCAEGDRDYMRQHGKNTLYLSQDSRGTWQVGNWPGSLTINCSYPKVSWHNIAGVRYDVWFAFDGNVWHGYTCGNDTQICHCKRTKQTVK